MIGTEAFPDLLSTFSTKYVASNRNRSTNLMLAGNKINGTVLMPGETFSYNKVVGARTIAAGYKEAPIYVMVKKLMDWVAEFAKLQVLYTMPLFSPIWK